MTAYSHRYIIFAQANKLTAANNAAKAWDPDTGGDKTFGSVRLSADGTEPPTHYGCNTASTDQMQTKILQAMSNVPFYAIYKESDGWDWDSALADAGLQVIETEGV